MIFITVIFLLMYDFKALGSNFGAVMSPGQQNGFWDDIVFRNKGDVHMPQILMPDCPQPMRCVMRNFCSSSMALTNQAQNSLSFKTDDRGFLSCVMKHVPMLGVCCKVSENHESNKNNTISKDLILVDSGLLKEMAGIKHKINRQRVRQRPTPLPAPRFKKPTASAARIEMARKIHMKRFKARAEHLSFSSLIQESQNNQNSENSNNNQARPRFPITTRRPNIPVFAKGRRKAKQSSFLQNNKEKSSKGRRNRPTLSRNNKNSALINRFNQRYPKIENLFLRNLQDLIKLQEQTEQKSKLSGLLGSPAVFVSCPAAMKCVQRERCDMKGWMTEQPRSNINRFSTEAVPLIVCDDPNSSLQDTVCCRDTHYKENEEVDEDDYDDEYYDLGSDDYEDYVEDYFDEDFMKNLDSDLGMKALLDIVLREEIIEIAALERERRKVQKRLKESQRARPDLRLK